MEERYFNVKKAAGILGCSTRTVERLLADGWLRRAGGRPIHGEGGRVSEKSLFQLMVFDRVSYLPPAVLRAHKKGRKIFRGFLRQQANAKCLSRNEGQGITPDAAAAGVGPASVPVGSLPQVQPKPRCLHHQFAAEHQFSFGWRARQLAPGDPALQDDLVQEMSLAVLEYGQPASFEFLLELAVNRAKNYLRYEESRGMLPLSEARQPSDSFAAKMASLRNFIDMLARRGVPAEWIEEVLGERFEAA